MQGGKAAETEIKMCAPTGGGIRDKQIFAGANWPREPARTAPGPDEPSSCHAHGRRSDDDVQERWCETEQQHPCRVATGSRATSQRL